MNSKIVDEEFFTPHYTHYLIDGKLTKKLYCGSVEVSPFSTDLFHLDHAIKHNYVYFLGNIHRLSANLKSGRLFNVIIHNYSVANQILALSWQVAVQYSHEGWVLKGEVYKLHIHHHRYVAQEYYLLEPVTPIIFRPKYCI